MIKTGIYKHYKGNLYEVIGVAVHTETGEKLVVYKALYQIPGFTDGALWVRPLVMFCEEIEVDGIMQPRFVYQKNFNEGNV